ncbi:unnamed protein product [Ranitomeya imitator]|uniref:Uncharacterized protein n=1 Tax=Ranitomeya imitator TaxID=111125 RepID=A0ABN9LAG5_9NEOB|nr:unnamed protein product [Ranitomeya imitator]
MRQGGCGVLRRPVTYGPPRARGGFYIGCPPIGRPGLNQTAAPHRPPTALAPLPSSDSVCRPGSGGSRGRGAVASSGGQSPRPLRARGFFPDTLRIGRLAPYSVHDLPSGTALAVQAPFFLRKVMSGDARLLARTTTGISASFGRSSCCGASFPASLPRLIKSLPFVHTARRYYRLDCLVRSLDRPRRGRPRPMVESREDDRT